MDNSGYISLSLADTLRRSIDLSANNMANATTSGFKAERAVFESLLIRQGDVFGSDDISFAMDKGSYLDPRQGALEQTGNALDLAISGEGWFAYRTADGQTALGRDGRFVLDAGGALVTVSGAEVLDAGGGAIALPVDAGDITIGSDGTISTTAGEAIGVIGVFEAPAIQSYLRLGNGMFAPPDGTAPPLVPVAAAQVTQGFLEKSNVEPVVEMTRMMDAQRAYEHAVKMIDTTNSLREQTLRRLGQSG
ncbi:flagellar hook-basal body complex protein [Tabrizicola sp. WMC-M-20]|nr:flagellar hook-basal body complex protein [Tabrizicola sp. WMC-M-20]